MNIYSPANSFIALQHYKALEEQYSEWISNIPEGYFVQFCTNGLFPFLKSYGYTISDSLDIVVCRLDEWAFSHVLLTTSGGIRKERIFTKCNHSGGEEERHHYDYCISVEDWSNFSERWAIDRFLDLESDAGASQHVDLASFVWQLIDLHASKAHHTWVQLHAMLSGQDELQFGGTILYQDE